MKDADWNPPTEAEVEKKKLVHDIKGRLMEMGVNNSVLLDEDHLDEIYKTEEKVGYLISNGVGMDKINDLNSHENLKELHKVYTSEYMIFFYVIL